MAMTIEATAIEARKGHLDADSGADLEFEEGDTEKILSDGNMIEKHGESNSSGT